MVNRAKRLIVSEVFYMEEGFSGIARVIRFSELGIRQVTRTSCTI